MPVDPEYLHLVYPKMGSFEAFLYGRNSVDPKKRGRSVRDQLTSGRDMCDRYGWPIIEEFRDVGLSASRYARKKRGDFDDMLERIRAGEPRIVVAFEASRYYRDLEVYVQLRSACEEGGVLLCYNGQVYDLSKGADREATALDAVRAEGELEGIRNRNLNTAQKQADRGGPHGPAAYGFRRVYDPKTGELVNQVVDEKESKHVTALFEGRVAGKAKRAMAAELNELGETTRLGKPWSPRAVSMVLRNKAYIGIRVHRGVEHPATWEGFIDRRLFDDVQALEDADRKLPTSSTAVKHTYSGLPICGVHEGAAQPDTATFRRTTTGRKRPVYRCNSLDLSVDAERFEAYVEEGVVAWLSSPEAAEAFKKPADGGKAASDARARLSAIQEQLRSARKLARTFGANNRPLMSSESLSELEMELGPEADELKATIKRAEAKIPRVLEKLLGNPEAEHVWNALDLSQKRLVLSLVVTIRVFKARAPGVKRIEPGRVTLSFYGQPGYVVAQRKARRSRRFADAGD
ncbi:recombinase family protein [Streptomyces sp. R302]|uniref:recombinase family protein n=1 Tax=unclassified Streptomyces TaxID=2593676 RepID=UPI00145EA1E0|nr:MULTISPECIES: recombinase family protein [unclassified Streptomyces]NML55712.1 recombinase family protein [Streptomyces sp. R301]NML83898.1 recombinase family protein [Streptomyces sp. R302]